MTDILLSTLTGSGVGTITRFADSALVGSGASGTIATIVCPANRVVRLMSLVGSGANESGMSVDIGGVNVFSGTLLTDATINALAVATTPYTGGLGENIDIIKDTGSTVNDVRYSYQLLE